MLDRHDKHARFAVGIHVSDFLRGRPFSRGSRVLDRELLLAGIAVDAAAVVAKGFRFLVIVEPTWA